MNNNLITILVSVVASAAVSAALTMNMADKKVAPAENQSVEEYLMKNPSIVRKALEAAARQEQEEAERKIAEAYKANLDALHDTEVSPFVGPKDAKITIVEFFDFNCGYCKRLAPEMMKVIKANPDVRFIFKPVAFLAPSSQTAAKAMLAAAAQGKFIDFYEGLLTFNGRITDETVDEFIKKSGLDVEKTKELMKSDDIQKKFNNIVELSQKVQIRGVPTLIINGESLPAIEEGPIQEAINKLK